MALLPHEYVKHRCARAALDRLSGPTGGREREKGRERPQVYIRSTRIINESPAKIICKCKGECTCISAWREREGVKKWVREGEGGCIVHFKFKGAEICRAVGS